jgi:hypothetical protein
VKIAYPDGPEFDILALFADGSGEPDDWWRFWFQSGLDGVMKFTPARTRKYFFRLVAVTGLLPTPFAIEIMNTSWAGEPGYQNVLGVDPSIAASPDVTAVNAVATEPPQTDVRLLRFAAALRHELIHLTKHRASHKTDPVGAEKEAHAGQRDFILRAAKHFGVPQEERDRLIKENEQAEKERLAGIPWKP